MKITEPFEKEIVPFSWVDYGSSASVCLTAGEYLQEVFDTRSGDGFTGNKISDRQPVPGRKIHSVLSRLISPCTHVPIRLEGISTRTA